MTEKINWKSLLPGTEAVLRQLSDEADFLSNFVMVGGSALSVRLCHRLSEDLDFFTYYDNFDKKRIYEFFRGRDHRILHDAKDQIDLVYNGVKLSFFNARWSFLKPAAIGPVNVASLPQLAAMKIHTLFVRATFRDYYDLYWLSMEMSLGEIYKNALLLMDGLNYKLFSTALVYVDDIEDENIAHLNPATNITREQISQHFVYMLKTDLNRNS